MSMLSVPVKDLNEKTTIDNNTYVVCGNTEANKITYANLVKPLKDELNSTLTGAIYIKTYSMTLTANNYVQPFTMFGDGIIPDADIKKYGSPIAICAIQKSYAPGAAALRWNTGKSAWQYLVCSNMAETDVNITFMKLS